MSTNGTTTKRSRKESLGPYGRVGQAVGELDDRLGVAKGGRVFLDKIFPDHWSFMLGEISLYSFVVLLATGVFLSLYFVPSSQQVIYHGSYRPLDGQWMSEAYKSTVQISLNVRGGLLVRQMHHWAADIFTGSIIVHMARIFFTGAFRKPRELNWIIGTTMLILAILEGFIGYSLPDDLISGTGLRIGYSIAESIPFIGSYLVTFLWGGQFPGSGVIIPRFFIIHVLIIPLVLIGLLSAHLGLLVRQKHTQFKGEGRTENNVVGSPMFPTFMAKTTGFLFMVTAASALLGAFAQINPIWQFGSYDASKISYAVQPDWYMGWLDGALRIMPSWELAFWGHTVPLEVFLPAVIFPGIVFNIAIAWPIIERRYTGDLAMHNLLDRPRDRPKRTAFGAAFFAMLFTLFAASSTDVLANFFKVSLNEVLWFFRFAFFIIPIITGLVVYQLCREMQGVHGIGKRKRAVIVRRSAEGEYSTVPAAPRPDDEHRELDPEPVPDRIDIEPLSNGGIRQPESSPTGAATGQPLSPPRGRAAARDLWVAAESIHAVTYFAPECRTALREAGLRGFWSGYFAARAAPLGPIGAGPVAASFFNFHPAMVTRAVPACWDVVAPETLCRVRAIAAADALGEVCSTASRSALLASLPLLRRAAGDCDGAGRMMAGANRSLWPRIATALGTGGLGEVWQGCTTLREHRGDGHVAALVTHGVSGVEAHVLAAGTKAIPVELLRDNRGWSEAEWDDTTASLARRGLLHADGRVTDAGRTLHGEVEELTDELAEPAYAGLSDLALEELHGVLSACAADVAASGVVPFPNPMGLPRPPLR